MRLTATSTAQQSRRLASCHDECLTLHVGMAVQSEHSAQRGKMLRLNSPALLGAAKAMLPALH